jgi:hypothetical protein
MMMCVRYCSGRAPMCTSTSTRERPPTWRMEPSGSPKPLVSVLLQGQGQGQQAQGGSMDSNAGAVGAAESG